MINVLSDFTVTVKLVNSEQLKATCSINYNDHVVRGFRIAPSKFQEDASGEYLRVLPPTYGVGEKTHLAFFMDNKDLWKEVSNRIIAAYLVAIEKVGKKQLIPDDIQFPDDIRF